MAKKFTQQETEKLIAGIREAYEIITAKTFESMKEQL